MRRRLKDLLSLTFFIAIFTVLIIPVRVHAADILLFS